MHYPELWYKALVREAKTGLLGYVLHCSYGSSEATQDHRVLSRQQHVMTCSAATRCDWARQESGKDDYGWQSALIYFFYQTLSIVLLSTRNSGPTFRTYQIQNILFSPMKISFWYGDIISFDTQSIIANSTNLQSPWVFACASEHDDGVITCEKCNKSCKGGRKCMHIA